MTEHDIYDLLQKGERVTLECKRAKNAVPNSVWETYSAFANTDGGVILLGVHEDLKEKDLSKRFTITGVEDAAKIKSDLWNMLNNPEKVNINLLKDDGVDDLPIDGKTIVFIRVPRAVAEVRPVYINGNPIRGSYKRNNEDDYHMSQAEIRMMLRDTNNEGNDYLPLEYYTMDDIDIPSLQSYRNRFSSANPEHVWNSLNHKDFLKQFGAYIINRETGKECLTMAGLLMFGKGLPIRERFSNLRMDYIDKSHLEGEQRYSDRLTYDGTWENNLYNFLEMTLPKLVRELPRPFIMEGMVRKDDTQQHKAVREAVTNAIIHADFHLNGLLRFVKYDNRLELTNPGLLKLSVDRIYAGEESKARNQSIQSMLRMIGFGEGLGSGFPLILKAWEEKHWIRPELVEEQDLMQVKLILNLENVTDDVTVNIAKQSSEIQENADKQDAANVTVNVTVNETTTEDILKTLNARQKAIMRIIIAHPKITVDELAERIIVTRRTVLRDIKALQQKGILSREGSDKSGRWVVKLG